MLAETKDFISECNACLAHRAQHPKEPLQPHNLILRRWSKVGADLCDFDNRILLVIVDYYSNCIEVYNVTNSPNFRKVIKALQDVFTRFGITVTLVSDNGPQLTSAEFATFASTRGFDHITSSSRYVQSNGKAEKAVKTVIPQRFS